MITFEYLVLSSTACETYLCYVAQVVACGIKCAKPAPDAVQTHVQWYSLARTVNSDECMLNLSKRSTNRGEAQQCACANNKNESLWKPARNQEPFNVVAVISLKRQTLSLM